MAETFERRADARLILSIIASGLLSFTGVVIETAMNVTFPTLMQEFGITTDTVQWVTTGYLLVLAMMIPTSSYLKKRFAMKHLFVAACLLFITGTVCGAIGSSFWLLLFGRLLQGAGTGIALPLMFNIVMEQAPLDKMGLMMGAAMLVCALAPAVGPSVGGFIVENYGWRMIFVALLPLLATSLIIGFFAIRQSSAYGPRPFDKSGWLLLAIAFTCLILGCGRLSELQTNPLPCIALFVAFLLAIYSFYTYETRQKKQGKQPLLNPAVFHTPAFTLATLGMLMMQFICLGIGFLIPNFSQLVTGENAFTAGCILLPGCLVGAAMAPVSGRIYDRLGARKPLLMGSALILLSQILFSHDLATSTTLSLTIIYVIFTIAQGLTSGNILTYGMSTLSKNVQSDGNAVFNTAQQLAGALGTSIAAAIVATYQSDATSLAAGTMEGTQITFYVLTVLAVLQGLFVYTSLKKGSAK